VQSLTIGGKTSDRYVRDLVDAGLNPYMLEAADYGIAKASATYNTRTQLLAPDATYTRMKNPIVIQTGTNRFLVSATAARAAIAGDPDHSNGADVAVRCFTVDATTNAVTLEARKIASPNVDPDGGALPAGFNWIFTGFARNDTTGRIYFIAIYMVFTDVPTAITTGRYFSCYTDDEFTTFTRIAEVTSLFKQTAGSTTWFVSIDNIGLRLKYGSHAGRLVVAGWRDQPVIVSEGAGLFYSDDNGATWVRGAVNYSMPIPLSRDSPNESAITQLLNGDIVMTARLETQAYKPGFVSTDGGATFDRSKDFTVSNASGPLLNGAVNSGICQCDSPIPRILYTAPDNLVVPGTPNSSSNRANGTLYISYDGARTFSRKYRFSSTYFGYSQPFPVRGNLIGIVSEGVGNSNATTELDLVSVANVFSGV
jgi:hypothetical protein